MTSTPPDAAARCIATPESGSVRPDPLRIIVPRKHGQLLIEPPVEKLVAAVKSSPAQPERIPDATPFGIDFHSAREAARATMLQAATNWARQTGAVLPTADAAAHKWVVTGHQVEFYHPGVWAKVLATNMLAQKSGAVAFDLLVDHDVVDHFGFDVPIEQDGLWGKKGVEWSPASTLPAESLHAPSVEGYNHWAGSVLAYPQAHADTLKEFLEIAAPADNGRASKRSYVEWLSAARSQVERSFGVNVHHVPATHVCAGETWQAYLHAWVTHADHWTTLYNKHLAAYRKRQGIKNPQHPMPDLSRIGDTVELPFWIYRDGMPRERLQIRRTAERTLAILNGEEFLLRKGVIPSDPTILIRPRALAFTMYVRLFLADLFIHGIGGALYDQITDGLMQDIVGSVPSYGCVSAAWLLPIGQPFESTDDLAALRWRRHHVMHNPQLAIDPFTAVKTQVAELIMARKALVTDIASSLETARRSAEGKVFRREAFRRLHDVNKELHIHAPRMLDRLDGQLNDALRMQAQNKVLLWREYFFALHARQSLTKLLDTVRSA